MDKNTIRTKLGTLRACVRNDPDYPGIDIRLERDGTEILLAWVEVNQQERTPVLQMRLYANCEDCEPTASGSIAREELDDYFQAVANGGLELN